MVNTIFPVYESIHLYTGRLGRLSREEMSKYYEKLINTLRDFNSQGYTLLDLS